ncbi:hypothetical protein D3C78_1878690 [compost metagenome]
MIHFRLGASTHDPGLAFAVTGQGAGDQFQLRVPGLAGIYQIAAGFHGIGEAGQGSANHLIVGKQLV